MTKFANLRLYNTASISVCPTQTLSFLCNPLKLKSQCAHLDEQATHAAAGYARDDANRSKRYAFCGYRCEEWCGRTIPPGEIIGRGRYISYRYLYACDTSPL